LKTHSSAARTGAVSRPGANHGELVATADADDKSSPRCPSSKSTTQRAGRNLTRHVDRLRSFLVRAQTDGRLRAQRQVRLRLAGSEDPAYN
jgi:hypothetical protein